MKCKKIERELPLYITVDLTQTERKIIEEHLQQCSRCTAELKALEATVSALGETKKIEVPTGYITRFRQKLADSSIRPAKRPSLRWAWALNVVEAAVIVLLAAFAFSVKADNSKKDTALSELQRQLNVVDTQAMLLRADLKASRNRVLFFHATREIKTIDQLPASENIRSVRFKETTSL